MKKVTLLTICAIISSSFIALQAREPYKPKSEITVRWGWIDTGDWDDWGWEWSDNYAKTPLERYNNGKYYYDDKVYTQAISVSYTNEIKRWLALSINGAYSGVLQNERDTNYNNIVSKYRKHRISVFPMVRFTYLNRPMIRLYSAAGLGFGMTSEKWSDNNYKKNKTFIEGQATFFGVSVGKTFFASWELGVGAMGIFTMGAGYRF